MRLTSFINCRYTYDEKWSFGAAYLYANKEDLSAVNSTLNDEFSSHLLTLSMSYRF